MPDKPFALSIVPPRPPAEDDYDAICTTMMESARGRWFLDEYARRNRSADTAVVLAAIERVEGAIRGKPYQGFRTQLLDMAKAITLTRAEVAEIRPQAQAQDNVKDEAQDKVQGKAARPPDNGQGAMVQGALVQGAMVQGALASPHILAAAEHISDVAWAMRERGFEPKTCDQIEALAASILSAPFLRNTDDQRTRQLSEVLLNLERRIDAMLEACGAVPAAAEMPARQPPETGPHASQTTECAPTPLATALVGEPEAASDTPTELEHGLIAAEPSPMSGPVVTQPAEPAESADERPAAMEAVATETATAAASAQVEPAASLAAEPATSATEQSTEAIEAPMSEAEPADFLLEPMPLPVSSTLPMPPVAAAVSESPAAESSLDDGAATEKELPVQAAAEPERAATVEQSPSPAAQPTPRASTGDPLAALKAMTDEERIALFT